MFDDVDGLDVELRYIASLLDQVRGKLSDRFLRIELADYLPPKSTPFRVPTGLGEAIDKRIAPAGLDALHLLRAIRDVNKDVPDNPDKLDAVSAAIIKLKKSLVPLAAEVGIQVVAALLTQKGRIGYGNEAISVFTFGTPIPVTMSYPELA